MSPPKAAAVTAPAISNASAATCCQLIRSRPQEDDGLAPDAACTGGVVAGGGDLDQGHAARLEEAGGGDRLQLERRGRGGDRREDRASDEARIGADAQT